MTAVQQRRFGGLGAIFFLATLGGIAYYVQQQSIPEEREALRTPATAVPEAVDEDAPPALPWEDRLDLAALRIEAFGQHTAKHADADTDGAPGAGPPDGDAEGDAGVDPASGRLVQTLPDGHRLLYTLDPVLQDSALTIFRNREVPYAGAVVIDLRDNAVLAFAGHSTANPQVDPLEVLTTAWAPAASTFKLITAASLLENEAATPSTKECFHGGLRGITDDLLRDDPALDERCETLSNAIAQSHNLVIGKLALKHLDEVQLGRTAQTFQYDSEIPFEFPVEKSPTHIPTDPKERAKVAAGFWHVDLSPLHGALIGSIFARGGTYQAPHIIDQVVGPDGAALTPQRPKTQRVLAQDIAQAVGKMMVGTTTEGTARSSFRDGAGTDFIPGVEVAGKTGSLTGKRAPAYNYNWFIGFAPADDPEIAFAVVLANEPKWKIKAHYAARRLVQIYLERRDAIAEQRDARLTAQGLVLPERDPNTGAIINATPPEGAAGSDAPTADDGLPDVDDALPPVPEPTAKPDGE